MDSKESRIMPESPYLTYKVACSLLRQFSIEPQSAKLVSNPREAVSAYKSIGAPVALKIISREETHKSDKGLLALDLDDEKTIDEEARLLLEKVRHLPVEGLLVQKMAPSGIEVLAGLNSDPNFGMMLAFGTGGTFVELLNDIKLRKTPISQAEAMWLVQNHPIHQLLKGYRNRPTADLESLTGLLCKLSQMGTALALELQSLDINPIIATSEGVFVVDFRIRMKGKKK
jgi:acetyltransferase